MRSVSCKCLDKSLVYTFFSNLFQNYGHANLTASFKVVDSIHWFDYFIRFIDSTISFDSLDEDQSTKKFFGGATKNKSENMDEDQSTKHFFGGALEG